MMFESENPDLKRIYMRSCRRGMKEMDVVLGPYARENLSQMDFAQRILYDSMLSENDQDLLGWITKKIDVPACYAALIGDIRQFAEARFK